MLSIGSTDYSYRYYSIILIIDPITCIAVISVQF